MPSEDSIEMLQWGPVVVTGIRYRRRDGSEQILTASMGSGRGDRNQGRPVTVIPTGNLSLQWGPVVVTGISSNREDET